MSRPQKRPSSPQGLYEPRRPMSEHRAPPHSVPEPGPDAEMSHRGRRLARFNRTVTNKITRRPARWLPQLGSLTHVGRRTPHPRA
jgi:hypothetical protein